MFGLLAEERKKATFVLSFEDGHQEELQRLVKEFNEKAKKTRGGIETSRFLRYLD